MRANSRSTIMRTVSVCVIILAVAWLGLSGSSRVRQFMTSDGDDESETFGDSSILDWDAKPHDLAIAGDIAATIIDGDAVAYAVAEGSSVEYIDRTDGRGYVALAGSGSNLVALSGGGVQSDSVSVANLSLRPQHVDVLHVIDGVLEVVGSVAVSGDIVGIEADGDYISVLRNYSWSDAANSDPTNAIGRGIELISVAAPESPVVVDSVSLADPRLTLIDDLRLYAIDYRVPAGQSPFTASPEVVLCIFDINTSGELIPRQEVELAGEVRDAFARDDLFYAMLAEELIILDVSDAENIIEVGSITTTGGTAISLVNSVAYTLGDTEFGADVSTVMSIDIADPEHPEIVSSAEVTGTLAAIESNDDSLFVLDSIGIKLLDVIDPEEITEITSSENTRTWGNAVVGAADYAWLGDQFGELLAIDPVQCSTVSLDSRVFPGMNGRGVDAALAVSSTLFVLTGDRLELWSIEDATAPEQFGDLDGIQGMVSDIWEPTDLEVLGDLAVAAGGWAGGVIIDASDPLSLTVSGYFTATNAVEDIDVENDHIFAVDVNGDLAAWEISSGQALYRGRVHLELGAWRVHVDDERAIVVGPMGGIQIVDVSDPSDMSVVDSFPENEGDLIDVTDMIVIDDYAYVGSNGSGLVVYYVGTVGDLERVAHLDEVGPAVVSLGRVGDTLVVNAGDSVSLLSLTDPVAPTTDCRIRVEG